MGVEGGRLLGGRLVGIAGGVIVCEGRRFCEGLEVRDIWCPCGSVSRRVV